MRCPVAVALVVIACLAQAQSVQFLGTPEKALMLLPARCIVAGIPGPHAVSPDGRYIAWCVSDGDSADAFAKAFDNPVPVSVPESKSRLVVYDRQTKQLQERGYLPKTFWVGQLQCLGNEGSVLIQQGALEPADLVKVVVEHTQEVIYSVFQWVEGFYRLKDGLEGEPYQCNKPYF